MPDRPAAKHVPHPWKEGARRWSEAPAAPARARPTAAYAELQVATNFSFLRGASHPEELVARAAELDLRAIAVTDRASLAGIVRAHVAARDRGVPLVVGARLELDEPAAPEGRVTVLAYPTDAASYGRLARLLTLGKRRAPKGGCRLALADLLAYSEGLLAVLVPPDDARGPDRRFAEIARRLARAFDDDRFSIAAVRRFGPDDRGALRELAALAADLGAPLVATGDVHHHAPERRALQDVLTCIRHGCTLDEAGFRLAAHAERHLKPPEEMAALFAEHPRAIARTVEIAERAGAFGLEQLSHRYPSEVTRPGSTPMRELAELTERGAAERYPGGMPQKVRAQIDHELALVDELGYAPYFLTVADLVRFARSRGILCQGRGAAANSAVCYCLGVTAVDPERIDLLFERFVSKERNEPPDIDVDFEHERREEAIQYVYRKYGRERAALTAEVITYRGRSAVRDVGKALGVPLDCIELLARDVDWWDRRDDDARLRDLGLDPTEPTLRRLVRLTKEILGFPRHLSQHVGGFVITEGRLSEIVPIENAAMPERTVIEWDKDDLDAMGILKVDVLGLGMLTCIRKTFELLEEAGGRGAARCPPSLALHTIPPEDPAVYEAICRADTVGVFQIESRAQMSMLPRLKPRCFYDLVIEVAIVRPGPIQGDMVHPYLRRRNGEDAVAFPSEAVRKVLGKTLGVPLFQEQAMALAVVAGGFTPGEADRLRRALAGWRKRFTELETLGRRLVEGMVARGYERAFAERIFDQLRGFSEYGFPESHAASFALLVYVSAWLKHHHPAAFAAALLNSQPMGFYAPAQIVRDARAHGVLVRAVDANASGWDCTLEPGPSREGGPALRLGMRLVKGLARSEADAIARAVRERGPFEDLASLLAASGVRVATVRRLASADAFRSMGLSRREAVWQARALRPPATSALPFPEVPSRAAERLPAMPPLCEVLADYAATSLSLSSHPLAFLRERLERRGVATAAAIADASLHPHGARAAVAGLVLVRQRPGTASGVVFVTLEDETGIANLILRPAVFERFRKHARHATVLLARGRVEREGRVVHLLVRALEGLDDELADLRTRSRDFH